MRNGFLLLAVAMLAAGAQAQESITSPGRIEEIVHATQEQFWQLVPPEFGAGDDFIYIHPDSTVRAVDWKSKDWPKDLLKQLYAEMETINSFMYPIYRITVIEARTGELLWYNSLDQFVWETPAPLDYNPYLFAFECWNVDSADELTELQLEFGRSSNVGLEIRLLPDTFMEYYAQDVAFEAAMTPMVMMMSLPAVVTNLIMAIDTTTNGVVEVEIGWPASFTNDLEIFATTDLPGHVWQIIPTNITTSSTTNFLWTDWDSTNMPNRFYMASNADLDTDADGLADGCEIYVYGSEPDNQDSDGDDLDDDVEVGASPPTDPSNSDTQVPVVSIASPVNNIVVMP